MAGVGWTATTAQVATGTSLKTILQVVAAANHALLIDEWSISFEGVSNTAAPIQVILARQSTAGTLDTAVTPSSSPDDSDETLQVTAGSDASVEPTTGDILDTQLVHPQTGYTWQAPFGKQYKVGGGDRLAIRVTAGANVDCVVRFSGTE